MPAVKNAFAAKGLQVAQAGVEQEEGVDAPDERGRERVPEEERQVDALDPSRKLVHRCVSESNAAIDLIVPSARPAGMSLRRARPR
jgi:hypothetical protein